jgi:hypothetical protein
MRRSANIAVNVMLVLAAVAFPIAVIVLAVEGDWGPAAVVAVVTAMTWWRGRHGGRYVPASVRSWAASRRGSKVSNDPSS